MFARVFRSLTRRATPRLPSPATSRCLNLPKPATHPSPTIRRFESNQPWGRSPGDRGSPPGRIRHIRWDPSQIQHAKPLVNADRISHAIKHPTTKWIVVFAGGSAVVFYFTHIEEVPVSGRRRFMCFSEKTVEQEAEVMYRKVMQDATRQGSIIPDWDPRSRMVQRVMKRLIAGANLEHVDFEVTVLESREMNAFVMPGGKVFVYSGILNVAKTDDGLAAILGHEIAHNLARHAAESMSSMVLVTPLRWLFIFLDATGYTGGLGRILGDAALGFGVTMPASRKQESEADYIGLLMMAKSCYDPKAAVGVWQRMEAAHKAAGQEMPEWLSTHPANSTRIEQMQRWLPEAEQARAESGCATTADYSTGFNQAIKGFWV